MTVRDYINALRKRLWLIVAVTMIGLLAALALTVTTKKIYEASAQLYVSSAAATDITQAAQTNTFLSSRVQSYTLVLSSPGVLDPAVAQLKKDYGLTTTRGQLASQVSADAPSGKVLINIHAKSTSPQSAAAIANAVAQQFSTYISTIDVTTTANSDVLQPAVKLTVTQPASVPGSPVSPRPVLNIGLGVLLGLLAGVLLALVRELLDNTFKSPEDVARITHTPVLGVIPIDRRTAGNPLAIRSDPHGRRAEAYRQLGTNLQFVDVDNPPRIIAITSALPGEGKSHTAINLAATLAEAGQRVCLIEADLRKPTVAKVIGLVGEVGLTSVLIGQATFEDVTQNAGANFAVLTSGPTPPNPTELLSSDHCRTMINDIAAYCDVVVVDTAPLLPVADGTAIAAMADATVMVVRSGRTTRDQVRRGVEALAKVGVTPVGVVLSMAAVRKAGQYGYYYYGYAPAQPSKKDARAAITLTDEGVPTPSADVPDADVEEPTVSASAGSTGTHAK